jgi:nitrate/nitrite transporter NarK
VGLLLATSYSDDLVLAMAALSPGTAGMLGTMPVFWTYPSAILGGTAAAASIALINSVGNLAGFVSPSIIGWMKDLTQSTDAGMYLVSAALLLGAVPALLQPRSLVKR